MGYVVIDKSYLQKVVNSASLNIIAATNNIVITDILLYEITSSEDKSSGRSCLKKLFEIKESAVFMEHSGGLVKSEIVNKRPCYPFSEFLTPRQYYPAFWEILCKVLNDDSIDRADTERFNKRYFDFYEQSNVERIKKIGNDVSKMFPELIGYKPGSRKVDTIALKKEIALYSDRIKRFTSTTELLVEKGDTSYTFKPSEHVDARWLYLRTFQTSLIYYVTYVEKYGDEAGDVVSNKLPHDSVDLEYCVCGVHAGKIATGDKMIRDIFSYFHSSDNCFYK
jgi:hypothetical protein